MVLPWTLAWSRNREGPVGGVLKPRADIRMNNKCRGEGATMMVRVKIRRLAIDVQKTVNNSWNAVPNDVELQVDSEVNGEVRNV